MRICLCINDNQFKLNAYQSIRVFCSYVRFKLYTFGVESSLLVNQSHTSVCEWVTYESIKQNFYSRLQVLK